MVQEGADLFASDGSGDIARFAKVKDQHGHLVLVAHGDGCHVHDAEVLGHCLGVGNGVVACGIGIFLGIGGIDAIDLGCLEQQVAVEFGGAEGGAGIGREEGVACASGQDDDSALLHVANGPAADEDLRNGANFDCAHDAAVHVHAQEFFLESKGVDDGAQHAHVVRRGLLDMALLGQFCAANDVATANHDGDLHASVHGHLEFFGDVVEMVGIDAKAVGLAEGLATDLKKDAIVFGLHGVVWDGMGGEADWGVGVGQWKRRLNERKGGGEGTDGQRMWYGL